MLPAASRSACTCPHRSSALSSVQAGAIKPAGGSERGKRRCDIRAGRTKAAICHHLLRRRARHRAVGAQPRAGGADRRALHLFPVLRVPAVARRRAANTRRRASRPAVRRWALPRRRRKWRTRLGEIRLAAREGHEIASHACGHFDGKGWSKADWLKEFASFKRILADAYAINGIEGEPADWKSFADDAVSGFRAPYLSTSAALYSALETAGFRYDASGISRGPVRAASGGRRRAFRAAANPRRAERAARHRHGLQSFRAPFGRLRAAGRGGGVPGAQLRGVQGGVRRAV